MFLTQDDLYTDMYREQLDAVSRQDSARINTGIKTAIAEVGGYLNDQYDTQVLWAQAGEDRHPLILSLATKVALWHITITLEEIPQSIEDGFNHAIKTLEKIQAGKLSVELPRKSDDEGEITSIKHGTINNRY